MQYDVKTPTEYMRKLEKDWRLDKLKAIRSLIKKNVPDIKEKINYKMLAYQFGGKNVFHLNVQKAYVGFYVGDTKKLDKDGSLLEGIDCGKGCIRFKKSTDIDEGKMKKLIKNAISLSKKGLNDGC